MKPEALDAMVNETMRPQALEAATTQDHEQGLQHGKAHLRPNEQVEVVPISLVLWLTPCSRNIPTTPHPLSTNPN
jgi:hypothetical protein